MKKGKYVMEGLFKVFNIAGMAFIFVGGHTGYISGKDMLYQLLLFVIIYCFMAHTYDAFEAQNKKNKELIYSQGLALFLADAVTYLTGHVTKTDGNSIWITVLILMGQVSFAAVYTLGSNLLFCHLYGRKEAAVLYGSSEAFEKMENLKQISDRIHVKMWIRILEVTPEILEQLKNVDLVILQEADKVQRDKILRYCAGNGIEVYLKPEMEDVLISTMKAVSVNGTMLLQMENGYMQITPTLEGVSAVSTKAEEEEFAIVKNPESVEGVVGETAEFTVEATGKGLTYQWQYCNANSTKWRTSVMDGSDTATVTVPVANWRDGQKYRCVVTNGDGEQRISETAVVTMQKPIKVQPVSVEAVKGTTAEFTVETSWDNVTYQWEYCNANSNKWRTSSMEGNDTATIKVPAGSWRNGQKYRCVITGADGRSVTSEAAVLTVISE